MYNNLNINNNSVVHSIASTTKSNQHRESFPYELMQDSTQLLQQYGDGDEGADGDDGGDDDDDDPDEVQLDGGVDGDDLPSPGRNCPAEICLPERSFCLGVFCPAEAAESFCGCSPSLRVSGGLYTPKSRAKGGPGWPHHLVARPRVACARGGVGPLWPISSPPSGFLRLLEK